MYPCGREEEEPQELVVEKAELLGNKCVGLTISKLKILESYHISFMHKT